MSTTLPAEPVLSSWLTRESTRYARVRATTASPAAGATTWTNQTLPAYANVQEIAYDATHAYVRSYGLASYVMGPWYLDAAKTQAFPNWPVSRVAIRRFVRNPAPAASKSLTGLGSIGMFVNGVSMFDNRDGFVWNGSAEVGQGTGYWNRDAWINEGVTFDSGFAHQEQSGNYHYHAHPPYLRNQLGDNNVYNAQNGTFTESTAGLHHSPILAWVADGFPLYGPYGYSDPNNAASPVTRMRSGFVLRNGQNGSDALTSTRATIPAWAQRAYGVGAGQSGPPVGATYPLGRYLEDNAYLGDLTNPSTGQKHVPGVDFDLNEWNCRFCVTPEFPNGTWAYFCTVKADGTPQFPYAIGRQYFGTPDNTAIAAMPTAGVTTVFKGGPDTVEAMTSAVPGGGDVVLTWSAVEGGTYRAEASETLATGGWSALSGDVVATGPTASKTDGGGGAALRRFYRVTRTDLATYATGGTTGGGGGGGSFAAAPASGARGATNLSVTFTFGANVTPALPPANVRPASIAIGTIAGTSITRNGTAVTAVFAIPANATPGAANVTISFPPAGTGPSYTVNGAFTIN